MIPVQVDLPLQASSIECTINASVRQGVPPDLVLAIRSAEGGKAGMATRNSDGTFDYGEAAINTRKFPELTAQGYDPKRLVADGCYAMEAKASIVKAHLRSNFDASLLARAARYHSRSPVQNAAYQERLAPWLKAWGCALARNHQVDPQSAYGFPPSALFAVTAGLLDPDLRNCPRQGK